jgi:hypothetical protein
MGATEKGCGSKNIRMCGQRLAPINISGSKSAPVSTAAPAAERAAALAGTPGSRSVAETSQPMIETRGSQAISARMDRFAGEDFVPALGPMIRHQAQELHRSSDQPVKVGRRVVGGQPCRGALPPGSPLPPDPSHPRSAAPRPAPLPTPAPVAPFRPVSHLSQRLSPADRSCGYYKSSVPRTSWPAREPGPAGLRPISFLQSLSSSAVNSGPRQSRPWPSLSLSATIWHVGFRIRASVISAVSDTSVRVSRARRMRGWRHARGGTERHWFDLHLNIRTGPRPDRFGPTCST